jgi:hypothetical protein
VWDSPTGNYLSFLGGCLVSWTFLVSTTSIDASDLDGIIVFSQSPRRVLWLEKARICAWMRGVSLSRSLRVYILLRL